MYDFVDTIETSEGVSLPSEALKINGEYIENLIEGYRTLTVEGREALSPEISEYETGIRDGSTMKGKRYPARIIRITYQLIAASNEAFREAYNKLASILNVTDAELIFNDETDKFFTGTPCLIEEVPPGRNSVVSAFEFLCLDPFKYSVQEYEVLPKEGETSVVIDYNGTYKSFPTLQAEFMNEDEASEDGETVTDLTGAGDCGYVAFFNEDEQIIQIGDPDEVDGESVAKSQTLINQQFNKSSSWGTAAKALWGINNGITSSSAVKQTGAPGMAVASYVTNKQSPLAFSTLKTVTSQADHPYFHYTVKARMLSRNETSVKIGVELSTRLDNTESYFGKGYSLSASVYIGGSWHDMKVKNTNDYWRSTTTHKNTFSVTVSGIDADTTKVQNIKFKAWRTDGTGGKAGTVTETSCNPLVITGYMMPTPDTYYLSALDYGTGSDWHGPGITRVIPADAAGDVGATNFTLGYSQIMGIGTGANDTKQLGAFQVLLVSGSGTSRKIVAGVNVYKGAAGKNAKLRFYVNHSTKATVDIPLTSINKLNHSTITKSGNTVTFNVGGVKKTYRDSAITNAVVTEVTFTFSKFGSATPLKYNGLKWVKFVKNNCDTWKNVPNKFSANDVVEANCKTGEILLNGIATPALGALGNDWEGFHLTPGVNQIGFAYSEWVAAANAPTFKVKYREVFI